VRVDRRAHAAEALCVAVCCSVLQRDATCYSVLQFVAVYCSVLQSVIVCCSITLTWRHVRVDRLAHAAEALCVAACCSVLQRVAACCSVLQSVAACCSMLQRVAPS